MHTTVGIATLWAAALASSRTLRRWSLDRYGKAVALRVGVDMRRPPDESDAPFIALFPDAVSERGLKHLGTLKGIVAAGERAAMFYCIQRPDACWFGPADMIDPAYAVGLRDAVAHGVEVYPHLAVLTVEGIGLEAECLSMV